MADSIIRLKVESQEYDAKLKRASEGLTRYADECRKVGGTLEVVEKDTLDYVRSLGRMDTASRTATGKLAEMRKAFVELSAQYKQMTDAEKASPFGKALAQSLSQLKTRIGESRTQIDGIKQEMNGGLSGALEAVASKFGLNISQLTKFGGAIAAAGAAAKVAKDAFFNNEEQLDEWGRTVESTKSVYEGFLNALNTGDIGGYISNINTIIQAARDAYDALDSLNTYNAFNQINIEKTRTGMTESIASYREGTGTKEQVRAAGAAYKKELEDRRKMEQEAYLAAIREVAAERGVNPADLQKALSGSYGNYQQLKNTPLTGTAERYTPGMMPGQAGTYTQYKVAANERERLGEALRHLNDTELQSLQALGVQAQRTATEVAMVDKQLVRVLNGRQGGTNSTTGTTSGGSGKTFKAESVSSKYLTGEGINVTESMNELKAQLSYWQAQLADATTAAAAGQAEAMIANLKEQIEAQPMALRLGISTEAAVELKDSITSALEEVTKDLKPIEVGFDTSGAKRLNNVGEETKGTWKDAASAVAQMGSALQSIEDPAAKIAGVVAQSIANVALSFSKALAETAGPWDWIAAAAAGTAAMISTIEAIHSSTGYAEGGIVGGNSLSGDNVMANGGAIGLNSGELILNKAQQSNIANALENPSQGAAAVNSLPYMRIDDIYLGLRAYGRKHGLGDPVFARI